MYDRVWSSASPCLLIFLLDQSESMLQPYDDRRSRLEVSTFMANRTIEHLIQMNYDGDCPIDSCFISIIGYNRDVKELCSGWLSYLDVLPRVLRFLRKTFQMVQGVLSKLRCTNRFGLIQLM